jgi:quinol monooxygenase YgiN
MTVLFTLIISNSVMAQEKDRVIHVARLFIDSAQLENYKAALSEEINTAVSKEPGVLMLYAVFEKAHPTHVTVFEVYANAAAYQAHRETPHFKKYKSTTQDMVKSLDLLDMAPIVLGAKVKL